MPMGQGVYHLFVSDDFLSLIRAPALSSSRDRTMKNRKRGDIE